MVVVGLRPSLASQRDSFVVAAGCTQGCGFSRIVGTMKFVGMNCRGLGSIRAVRALMEVQRQSQPDVVFLCETHLSKVKAERLMRKMGFHKLAVDESNGQSAGLLLRTARRRR